MLDWLTLNTDISNLTECTRQRLKGSQFRMFCVTPEGELMWEKTQRKSVRSDSHKLTMEYGSRLMIYGSPARVGLNRIDNVFGSDEPIDCAKRMIDFIGMMEDVELPDYKQWNCTKMDVTHNYHVGSKVNVLSALEMLRNVEGGRYQVRTTAETVYWSSRSIVRSGKAYSKGVHMEYLAKSGKAFLTEEELELCMGLLRLELSLKRNYFNRTINKKWYELTVNELKTEHSKYFGELVGSVEVNEMTDIKQACIAASLRLGMTKGYGRAAYLSWNTIRSVGYMAWRTDMPRSTSYRHRKILREAGLSYADFAARNVVPLRCTRIELGQPVSSWAELRKCA